MHDRQTKAPGFAVGITEPMIEALVHAFYANVRRDELLGPIFNSRIDDWDAHLAKLCRFWSSVTLMTGTYEGRPMAVHAALPEIEGEHFARWLALFEETARAVCPPDAAALFVDRAHRIAGSLKHGIDLHRGGGRLAAVSVP
ncbi:hemoglobin [Hyphomicrobium sp. 1Nfss2.1]|uniref:group III truncated hemoglobin n=1 Tax=Hyphomicrobium sp. 1Nfss2.1 TaxID=3413936 RepID=UPI003C7ADB38